MKQTLDRVGDFFFAPRAGLAAAVRKHASLPFPYYDPAWGSSFCATRLDAGDFVGLPIVRGPRRERLLYATVGLPCPRLDVNVRESIVAFPTNSFVRISGHDESGLSAAATAIRWPSFIDSVSGLGAFDAFVCDVGTQYCTVTVWSKAGFVGWAMPIDNDTHNLAIARAKAHPTYRESGRDVVRIERFAGGAEPPDVGATLFALAAQ